MKRAIFGFDIDDTLIPTQVYYSLAQADFIKHVLKTLGPKAPNAPTILKIEGDLDLKAVQENGFSKDRFPTSLAEAYRVIGKEISVDEEKLERGAAQAYKIGQRVFDARCWYRNLVKGASRSLTFLKKQGVDLFVVTTGDEEIQNKKADFYNLQKWFGENIHVVPHHKKEKLQELIQGREDRAWFVGNSARSDIAPALELGIGAIYIPVEGWAYDRHDLTKLDTRRLITLDEIGQIPETYKSGKLV